MKVHPPKIEKNTSKLEKIFQLQNRGFFKESLEMCRALYEAGQRYPDLLHFYALALRSDGDYARAIELMEAAIIVKPNDVTFQNTLAVLLIHAKHFARAEKVLKFAIGIQPNLFDLWNNLGNTLRCLERYEEAEKALKRAQKIDATRHEPYLNMALIMVELRGYKNAEKFMDKAIQLSPENPSLLVRRLAIANKAENFSYISSSIEKIEREFLSREECLELDLIKARLLEISGDTLGAIKLLEVWRNLPVAKKENLWSALGMLYSKIGQINDGITLHRLILDEQPNHITARWNLSLLQLVNGDVADGLKNYEARWEWREFPSMRRRFDAPRWCGEPLYRKKLLIWREQGIGDEIRFSSIIPSLRDSGATITFECSPKLEKLFTRAFPWMSVRAEGGLDCRNNPEYALFDYQIPVGSLARIFRNSINDFYNLQKPWLPRLKAAEQKVRSRLGVTDGQLLVGLCWRSSNQAPSRNRYYLLVEELAPLARLSGVTFVATQYDECMPEIEKARELGLPLYHYVNVNQKDDLLSACGLLGACDIVISANVSVADFCGGLGVPVIRMGPPQDAICLGTESRVPWYPTCIYMRMQQNNPGSVIKNIISEWSSIIKWATEVTSSERRIAS